MRAHEWAPTAGSLSQVEGNGKVALPSCARTTSTPRGRGALGMNPPSRRAGRVEGGGDEVCATGVELKSVRQGWTTRTSRGGGETLRRKMEPTMGMTHQCSVRLASACSDLSPRPCTRRQPRVASRQGVLSCMGKVF